MAGADETFVGGKEKNKPAAKRTGDTKGGKGEAMVFGMLERDGKLRAFPTAGLKAGNVHAIMGEHVAPGSDLMTDEHSSFVGLQGRYRHHTVNHSAGGEYVRHYMRTRKASKARGRCSSGRSTAPTTGSARSTSPGTPGR